MKKLTTIFMVFRLVLSIFVFEALGDSISTMTPKPGSVLEDMESDTIHVSDDVTYFGGDVTFSTDLWQGIRGKVQLVICLDQSGSMKNTDPDKKAVDVAKVFVDSLASMSPESQVGLVRFSTSGAGAKADAFYPVSLDDSANIAMLKAEIDKAGSQNSWTAYGAAIDSTISIFKSLDFDSSRAVIFLSDGDPNTGDGTDPRYQEILSSGLIDSLPPVHTVYFHTGSGTAKLRDTLTNLSQITDGSFTDVNNADYLYTIFLDSLVTEIVPPFDLANFYIENFSTELNVRGVVVDSNMTNPIVNFPSLYLIEGRNIIKLVYEKKIGLGTKQISKSFYINRTDASITSSQQAVFDSYFTKKSYEKSTTMFLDSNRNSLGSNIYYSQSYDSVYVDVSYQLGYDSSVSYDSVTIVTSRGDRERVPVTEIGSTKEFVGGIALAQIDNPTQGNSVLEVFSYDSLFLEYHSRNYINNYGQNMDKSFDTALVRYYGIDTIPPSVSVTWSLDSSNNIAAGSSYRIEWGANDNVEIVYRSIYLETNGSWELLDSSAGNTNGFWDWKVPAQTFSNCRIRISVCDVEGSIASDTVDTPFDIIVVPYFSTKDTVVSFSGNTFSFKVNYKIPNGTSADLKYIGLPSWMFIVHDSVWGYVPTNTDSIAFKAVLTGEYFSDTISVVGILSSSSIDLKNYKSASLNLGVTSVLKAGGVPVVTVSIPASGLFSLNIYDVLGRNIWSYNGNAFKAGKYNIRLSNTNVKRISNAMGIAVLKMGNQKNVSKISFVR